MQKTYTFRRFGYEFANDSAGIRFLNVVARLAQRTFRWNDDVSGPAYFISTVFDFSYSTAFEKSTGVVAP
jgi:hypothetical protein